MRPGYADYDFIDRSIDDLYRAASECFNEWIGRQDGVTNLSKWVNFHLSVYRKYFQPDVHADGLTEAAARAISESNLYAMDTLKALADLVCSGRRDAQGRVSTIKEEAAVKHAEFQARLMGVINDVRSRIEKNA